MEKREKRIKAGGIVLCEIFAIFTIVIFFSDGEEDCLAMALGSMLLVLVPMMLEVSCRCRICLPVYLTGLIYAVGPMLGKSWKFYYTVPGWDKLLHTTGGVMFAIVGAFFFDMLSKYPKSPGVRTAFAFCFSVAVAALWEFAEFGADMFFGKDMQHDTIVHGLSSYLLSDSVGVTGHITDIHRVVIDGVALPVDGYIDIGLIDSMMDMLLETLGAAAACMFLWFDKGRHPLIRQKEGIKHGDRICAL